MADILSRGDELRKISFSDTDTVNLPVQIRLILSPNGRLVEGYLDCSVILFDLILQLRGLKFLVLPLSIDIQTDWI